MKLPGCRSWSKHTAPTWAPRVTITTMCFFFLSLSEPDRDQERGAPLGGDPGDCLWRHSAYPAKEYVPRHRLQYTVHTQRRGCAVYRAGITYRVTAYSTQYTLRGVDVLCTERELRTASPPTVHTQRRGCAVYRAGITYRLTAYSAQYTLRGVDVLCTERELRTASPPTVHTQRRGCAVYRAGITYRVTAYSTHSEAWMCCVQSWNYVPRHRLQYTVHTQRRGCAVYRAGITYRVPTQYTVHTQRRGCAVYRAGITYRVTAYSTHSEACMCCVQSGNEQYP